MAGAVSALADPASVWYNPAGLAQQPPSARFQIYQATELDAENDELGTNPRIFGGFQTNVGVWTSGLFFFTPYSMRYGVDASGEDGRVSGRVEADYHTVSFPLALSAGNGRLKMGATLDWNYVSVGGSRLTGTFNTDNPRNPGTALAVEAEEPGGVSFSAGVSYRLLDYQSSGIRVRVGAVYRSGATDDLSNQAGADGQTEEELLAAERNRLTDKVLFGRPSSMALGLATVGDLVNGRQWALALQWDQTSWDNGGDYTKLSSGAEYRHPLEGRYDLELAWRMGLYTATAGSGDTDLNWPDMTALTLGAGLKSRDTYQVDVSLEYQSTEGTDRQSDSGIVMGLELSQFF
jgi:hypothetical protein